MDCRAKPGNDIKGMVGPIDGRPVRKAHVSERDCIVREVGPRDGLQLVGTVLPTETKLDWIRTEAAAGIPEIEVCSFVPPSVVPQFADAAAVAAGALAIAGLTVSALIPNRKGAELGVQAGVHKLNYVLSVSESHNQANVRRSTAESLADFRAIAGLRREAESWGDTGLAAGLSTAFGCTIEGPVAPEATLRLVEALVEAGADEIILADTVGYAAPGQVRDLFRAARKIAGDVPLVAHFHDTRGLGLANALAALEADVRLFDASLAGLGGCPFAPGATGNIVMEDLVFLLEAEGLATGVDLDGLKRARDILARALPEEPLHGRVSQAGVPLGFRPASPLAAE